jgi:hypothetical protein
MDGPTSKSKRSLAYPREVDFDSDLPFPFWRQDPEGAAMAPLVPDHVSLLMQVTAMVADIWTPRPRGTSLPPNANAMAGLETAAWRAPLTTPKTLDDVRVVAVVVSGDAGLCIKRQTYPRCGSDEQREVELLERASHWPHILVCGTPVAGHSLRHQVSISLHRSPLSSPSIA